MRTASNIPIPTPSQTTAFTLLGAGGLLLALGAARRSSAGKAAAVAAVPLLLWATRDWWRGDGDAGDDTRSALGGDRGIRVREAIRLERPIDEVYAFWRRLEQLPRFMQHLDSVRQDGANSHWAAVGPGGLRVEWDAAIINDEPNKLLAWQSLPGGDVTTAGSVNFDRVRGGSATQVTVTLQYAPPAGKLGSTIAWLFGREPSQTIREDLRRLKQLLEAGEIARVQAPAAGGAR